MALERPVRNWQQAVVRSLMQEGIPHFEIRHGLMQFLRAIALDESSTQALDQT